MKKLSKTIFISSVKLLLEEVKHSDLFERVVALNLNSFCFEKCLGNNGIKQVIIEFEKDYEGSSFYLNNYGVKQILFNVNINFLNIYVSEDIVSLCDIKYNIVDTDANDNLDIYLTLPINYYSVDPQLRITNTIANNICVSNMEQLNSCSLFLDKCIQSYKPIVKYGFLYLCDLECIDNKLNNYILRVSNLNNLNNLNNLLSQCINLNIKSKKGRELEVEILEDESEKIQVDINFCTMLVKLSQFFESIALKKVYLPFT